MRWIPQLGVHPAVNSGKLLKDLRNSRLYGADCLNGIIVTGRIFRITVPVGTDAPLCPASHANPVRAVTENMAHTDSTMEDYVFLSSIRDLR